MSSVKEEVQAMLRDMPDDCSFEEIQYRLYVLEKIRTGIESAEREGTFSQAEVEESMREWLSR